MKYTIAALCIILAGCSLEQSQDLEKALRGPIAETESDTHMGDWKTETVPAPVGEWRTEVKRNTGKMK